MLYSLSLGNDLSYRELLTGAETYVQCVHGAALGARWREVWCHHGGLTCAAMPAACPAICGDGVVGGDEDCDQSDLAGKTCTALGFAGGSLGCTPGCSFDAAACVPHEAPTTGESPTTGEAPTDSSGGEPSPDSATAGAESASDGCGCATGPVGGGWLLGLLALGRRRRGRMDSTRSRP